MLLWDLHWQMTPGAQQEFNSGSLRHKMCSKVTSSPYPSQSLPLHVPISASCSTVAFLGTVPAKQLKPDYWSSWNSFSLVMPNTEWSSLCWAFLSNFFSLAQIDTQGRLKTPLHKQTFNWERRHHFSLQAACCSAVLGIVSLRIHPFS